MVKTEKSHTTTTALSYPFDFPYLNTKDVQVELNGTRLTPIEDEDASNPHQFTRQTTQITLVTAPVPDSTLRIYRTTDDSNLNSTFYPGSAIRSFDLNDNFTQNLFTTQENTKDAVLALDNSRRWDATLDNGNGDWKSAFDKAADAVATADLAEDKADTAKLSTDSLVATNNGTAQNPVWVLQGDGNNTTQNNKGVAYAVSTADTAKDAADITTLATDNLVATNSGTSANPIWVLQGDGSNTTQNNKGVAYAVDTAETAKDTFAVPAKTAADTAKAATDALVATNSGTEANPVWVLQGDGSNSTTNNKGVSYAVDKADTSKLSTDSLVATNSGTEADPIWVLQGDGSNSTTNNKGVKYAVEKVDDWIVNGDGVGANEEGVPYAVQQSTDAVADATAALTNSRRSNNANPPVYTSAISISEDAYDNAVRQSSDPNWSPSGGTESAIRIAEAAEVTAASAVATANTASANATAAQNAVTNAELFTPYATVSDIPANNVASITVTAGGSEYQTVPAVTITNTTGATGSGAAATAVLTDGVVTSITVNTKGNNYDNGATVAIAQSTGTGGTHATATAVLGPLNEEKAEVADSTGLETFTPLTGTPAGFILGDDGLTVKLKYNTSSTTWEWVNYYSNDPETRYRKKIIIENKINIDEDYAVGVGNNGFSVGPVSIANNKILTIPNNSTYLVL